MDKKIFSVMVVAALCLFSVHSGAQTGGTKERQFNPAVVFDSTSCDFSVLEKGKSYKHDFVFTNNEPLPVVIDDVKASCVCTKVKSAKKPVPPGGKGVITVSYNARDEGAFRKDVEVRLKSGVYSRTLTLTVKGSVKKK